MLSLIKEAEEESSTVVTYEWSVYNGLNDYSYVLPYIWYCAKCACDTTQEALMTESVSSFYGISI